tara:strand:+ start:1716 stop:2333 length:618 start_codon:yes stop_codon:yes gene_type:complete
MSELPDDDKNVLLEIKPVEELVEEAEERYYGSKSNEYELDPTEPLEPVPVKTEPEPPQEEKIFKKPAPKKKRKLSQKQLDHLARCREKSKVTRKRQSQERQHKRDEEAAILEKALAHRSGVHNEQLTTPKGNSMDSFFDQFDRFVSCIDKLDSVREKRQSRAKPSAATKPKQPHVTPTPPVRAEPHREASTMLTSQKVNKYDGFF